MTKAEGLREVLAATVQRCLAEGAPEYVEVTDPTAVEVEVTVETGTYEGGWQFAARAEVPPEDVEDIAAIRDIARLLWDEAYTGLQGVRRRLTFTTYGPNYPEDGHAVRTENRP